MGIKDITVNKLNKIAKRKPMICFGAGEVFQDMFRKTENLHMEKNVKFVIDNDKTKWYSEINVCNVSIPVMPIEVIKEIDIAEYTIVITSKSYTEIYAQLQKYLSGREVVCFIYSTYRDWLCKLFRSFARKLPLKNYILLQGEGDTCENANAVGKYIREHNYLKKYKLIWLCDNPDKFSGNAKEKYIARNINMQSKRYITKWKYYYYKACAKYLMFENEVIEKEREGQISVYMNHGSPPLKSTLGHIVLPKNIDYVMCPSQNVADIVSFQYSVGKDKLIYGGSPRTDIFFEDEKNERLRLALGGDKYEKVILWAPTFRSMSKKNRVDSKVEYPYGVPMIYSQEDYDKIVDVLRCKNVLLLIKPHIYQDMSKWILEMNDNIRIITQNELDKYQCNVYDVMKISDSLITDYSTIAFDYMLLDRMIGYTLEDMDKYTIGFSVDNPLEYMPGTKIYNVDEFVWYIENVCDNVDEFRDARRKVSEYIHIDKGRHSEKLLYMLNII